MEGLLETDGNYRARYEKRETPYQIWQRGEGIPINKGSFAPNLHTVEVAPWPRIGQKGAFVNLADQQQDDGWVIEIAPGGHTEVLRHACEATVHVLSGRGATQIWQDAGRMRGTSRRSSGSAARCLRRPSTVTTSTSISTARSQPGSSASRMRR
ncbi:MAG: Cupin domain protein [Chloroflexi bacterium]|nr:Cupin domain protein [Chloroflexota bacterium]